MKISIFLIVLLFLAISDSLHAESDTLWTKYIGSSVRTVKFSPDGRYVYAAVTGRSPMMLDANTGEIVREFKEFTYVSEGSYRLSIAVSKDGKRLFAGDNEAKFYVWDTESGELIKTVEIDNYNTGDNLFYAIDVSEKHIVYNLRYKIANTVTFVVQARDINTYELIKDVVIKNNSYLLLSNDGSKLAVAGISDKNIELFETETWGKIGTLVGHTSLINDLSFSPDGSILASCDDGGTIKIWDIEKKEMVNNILTSLGNLTLCIIYNNDELITIDGDFGDRKLKLYEIKTGKVVRESIKLGRNDADISNNLLVVGTGSGITLVNLDNLLSTGETKVPEIIYPNPVNNVLIIPKQYLKNSITRLQITDIQGKEYYNLNPQAIMPDEI